MESIRSSNFSEKDVKSFDIYEFELRFDQKLYILWLEKNWNWIFFISGIYVAVVYQGQRLMKKRNPFHFKWSLTAWNFSLAIFSAAALFKIARQLFWQLKYTGFQDTLCHYRYEKSLTTLWGALFTFSKIFEFGDTLFLILAKKPVIFLHWYHHASVAIYAFFAADNSDPAARWFVVINSFVHTVMYSYFSLKSIGVKIPRIVALSITCVQISQMVFGIYVNILTSYLKAQGIPCERSDHHIRLALIMYTSYLILFVNFFYKSYVARPIKRLKSA